VKVDERNPLGGNRFQILKGVLTDVEVEGVDEQADLVVLDFLDDVETLEMFPYREEVEPYRLKENPYPVVLPQIG